MSSLWKYVIVGVLCFVLGSAVIVSAQAIEERIITDAQGGPGGRDRWGQV